MLFRFLRNPVELKSIKNISLLRHQMAAAAAAAATTTTTSSSSSSSSTSSNGVAAAAASKLAEGGAADASCGRYSPAVADARDYNDSGVRGHSGYHHHPHSGYYYY